MISPPTILVQCDQLAPAPRAAGERCRRSSAMTIAMSLDGSSAQLRNLFLAAHPGWAITSEGKVYCPQCAEIARARLREAKQLTEVGGA